MNAARDLGHHSPFLSFAVRSRRSHFLIYFTGAASRSLDSFSSV
jgi:hypothetical protein